jgi:peptidoglycan lytic transglycosylase
MTRKILPLLTVAVLLAGCGTMRGGYYQNDGPPKHPRVDLSSVAEPTPRAEPLSESGNDPYIVFGETYYPLRDATDYRERGIASWYGKKFHGKRTSSGDPYDMYAMTAAHRTLPLPSYARVTNLGNGRAVIVRVNDRGPFLHNRLIDLSYAAALKLGIVGTGTGIVEVEALTVETNVAVTANAKNIDGDLRPSNPAKLPRLYMQVGAFKSWKNAVTLRSRLSEARFGQVFIQSEVREDVRFYRVRVGPIASVAASDALIERALRYGLADAHIVVE